MNLDFTKISSLLLFDPSNPIMFGSSFFLFLFFFLLLSYRLLSNSQNARILLLIIFSLYFYYKASGVFVLLLILNAVINFHLGKLIFEHLDQSKKRIYLLLSLLFNLGVLILFKYSNLYVELVSRITHNSADLIVMLLPIGLSFYTFKSLSYIIDIYYENIKPINSIRDFSLYVFFFANILAGPIDRAKKFLPQINQEYKLSNKKIATGLFLIMMGLVKKIMIADYISLNFIDRVFEAPLRFSGVEKLFAVYGYTLQLYCDFSGYSDIAIGVALLLGFSLMENFNYPFKAKSISDFWKRWHISLSTWLLDYVFRPLQINLRNMRSAGTIISLIITFVLIGIWHGTSWAFVLWGVLHGIYMSIGYLTKKYRSRLVAKLNIKNSKILGFLQIFVTLNLIIFAFIFFRANSFENAIDILHQIAFVFKPGILLQFIIGFTPTFLLITIGFAIHFLPNNFYDKCISTIGRIPMLAQALLLAVVIWIVVQVQYADLQPYIYFNF